MAYRTIWMNCPEDPKNHQKPRRVHAVDARECVENGSATLHDPKKRGGKKKVENKTGTADLTDIGDDINLTGMSHDQLVDLATSRGIEGAIAIVNDGELIAAIQSGDRSLAEQIGVKSLK